MKVGEKAAAEEGCREAEAEELREEGKEDRVVMRVGRLDSVNIVMKLDNSGTEVISGMLVEIGVASKSV